MRNLIGVALTLTTVGCSDIFGGGSRAVRVEVEDVVANESGGGSALFVDLTATVYNVGKRSVWFDHCAPRELVRSDRIVAVDTIPCAGWPAEIEPGTRIERDFIRIQAPVHRWGEPITGDDYRLVLRFLDGRAGRTLPVETGMSDPFRIEFTDP
jgi:hypothetical protein